MNVEDIILYEDNHLLIIDKPAGFSSLPNQGDEDILTLMKELLKARDNKKNVFLHPVHRLDKQVSGILVMAKTSKALSRLNEQIREKKWKKIYIAKLSNKLPSIDGELVHFITKRKFYADVYSIKKPYSKEAVLHYRHIKDTLYEIELKTGRYHQIRAQMGFMKCPIIGDHKYGAKKRKSKHIYLHHAKLTFHHPVQKQNLLIDSKPMFL